MEEQEASRAELELLLADGQGCTTRYQSQRLLKPIKVKGKKGKEKPSDGKLPDVNVVEDTRFCAFYISALDLTDPQFERSAAYIRRRQQKQQSGDGEEATEEAENPFEQVPSDDRVPGKDVSLDPTGVSLEREKRVLHSLVI